MVYEIKAQRGKKPEQCLICQRWSGDLNIIQSGLEENDFNFVHISPFLRHDIREHPPSLPEH